MADEDRPAAPDDNRPGSPGSDAGDSDWFFRERFNRSAEPAATDRPAVVEPGLPAQQLPPPTASAYYGPFGSQPAAAWSAEAPAPYGAGATQPPGSHSQQIGSGVYGYPSPEHTTSAYPPPTGQPVEERTGPTRTPGRSARRPRTGFVLLLTALLAAVVGLAAGYGGSRLAMSGFPSPGVAPTVSAPKPSSTGPPGPQRTPVAPPSGQMDTVRVAAAALPSTVMITVGSGSTGSGFVLDTDGHIMTNNHVVAAADGDRITVAFADGARERAELVGRSPSYDLAVIKLSDDHKLTPMPVGDSDAVQVGEPVVAIGSPLALASTVTQGIVSAKNRPVVVNSDAGADSPSAYINGIQTDAAINPGNSGGPMVDAGARVIGVNSAILTMGQSRDTSGNIGLGFAIPINQAMEIGTQLIKSGKATYPVIGVKVDDAKNGVRLSEVDPDGPADKAGLQVDDLITAVDDHPVVAPEELIVAIRIHRPGDRVTLTYERGGQQRTAEVTLGSREG